MNALWLKQTLIQGQRLTFDIHLNVCYKIRARMKVVVECLLISIWLCCVIQKIRMWLLIWEMRSNTHHKHSLCVCVCVSASPSQNHISHWALLINKKWEYLLCLHKLQIQLATQVAVWPHLLVHKTVNSMKWIMFVTGQIQDFFCFPIKENRLLQIFSLHFQKYSWMCAVGLRVAPYILSYGSVCLV